jgi:hypothetical protein
MTSKYCFQVGSVCPFGHFLQLLSDTMANMVLRIRQKQFPRAELCPKVGDGLIRRP